MPLVGIEAVVHIHVHMLFSYSNKYITVQYTKNCMFKKPTSPNTIGEAREETWSQFCFEGVQNLKL